MGKYASVFNRHHNDGSVSSSSKTFAGDGAEGAAIRHAGQSAQQNKGDKRVTTYVEQVN